MLNVIKEKPIEKAYLTLKEASEMLGLKYGYLRKLLLRNTTIGFYDYEGKRLWAKADIITFRDRHFVAPKIKGE
jgi:hypothetical protein